MHKLFLKNSSGNILKDASGNAIYFSLPEAYEEVEYIENTSTAFLSTVTAANKLFVIDLQFTSNATRQLMGISGSSSAYWGNNKGTWEKIGISGTSKSTLDRVRIYYDVGNITSQRTNTWIEGATDKYQGADTSWATASANPLRIFNLSGSSSYACLMKLFNMKVFDANGNMLNYFVPCYRKSDNVIGMYDLVNNVFYTNAGSGTFIKGPRIPSEYQEVEYIQSSGGQILNTGLPLNMNTDGYEIKAQATTASQNGMILGDWTIGNNYYWLYHYNAGSLIGFYLTNSSNTQVYLTTGLSSSNLNANVFTYKNKKLYTNGTMTADSSSRTFSVSTNNCCLFKVSTYAYKGNIYYCKLYHKESLMRYLIPCYRKSDNVIGMYDKVEDKFYTNSGTGTFTKGEDVN